MPQSWQIYPDITMFSLKRACIFRKKLCSMYGYIGRPVAVWQLFASPAPNIYSFTRLEECAVYGSLQQVVVFREQQDALVRTSVIFMMSERRDKLVPFIGDNDQWCSAGVAGAHVSMLRVLPRLKTSPNCLSKLDRPRSFCSKLCADVVENSIPRFLKCMTAAMSDRFAM